MTPDPLRVHLARVLDWGEAHVTFDKAVEGIPRDKRGAAAAGFEHSPWQLLEHIRIAQKDILDFCVNTQYVHALKWPGDYWPNHAAPESDGAWDASVADSKADREKVKQLALDPGVDLLAAVPTAKKGQTILRGVLLVADHTSYHLGQLVAVRKALGIW